MGKHFVAPATAEEMGRTLGVTREDKEIVHRILVELGEYDDETLSGSGPDAASSRSRNKHLKKRE